MRRFFFHYNKKSKLITLHYLGKCHIIKDLEILVPTESHWNKNQPYLVIRGFAKRVSIIKDRGIITNEI